MKAVVLAAGLLIASAAPAFAQAGKVTAGFNLGMGFPITPDFDDVADPDLALAGHVTVGIAAALAVRGELGQSRFKPSSEFAEFCDAFETACDQKLNHASIGIQYGGFGDRGALGLSRARALPYGFISIGSYQLSGDLTDTDAPRELGFNTGFGVNIRIDDNVGIQVDVHVHGVRPGQDAAEGESWQYWATPSAGVWVGF